MGYEQQEQVSAAWQAYYDEIEPLKRVRIYAENMGSGLADPKRSSVYNMRGLEPATQEDDLRKELFLQRHTGPRGQEVDKDLWALMELMRLSREKSMRSAGDGRLLRKILRDLGFDVIKEQGEQGRELLYLELRNAVRRYLACCTGADYAKAFFGMVAATKERQNEKTTEDIWYATKGLARKCKRILVGEDMEHFELYAQAVLDAFYAFYPEAGEWMADYERKV